ncbi:ribose-5-phosphate isomerase RpiA [Listeria sp. PSOL-1]|uniref:ribose-5-phosphate isomerase RpiA n=1 Tax=Listeria sp. PSOL-1 TaxID=1844999 RepID=UPI0013D131DF|nr:ribose-5-phosphate isomerase RpiA [Listeria sp. PSOL-1]
MNAKKMAALKACEHIKAGSTIGLGTGSTAYYAIKRIAKLIQEGMNLKAVATSRISEQLAHENNIPLYSLNDVEKIDLTIDGADEVDHELNGIKGGGGALLREKIVATASTTNIWIVDESKQVNTLGRFPLAVEVVSFGHEVIKRKLGTFAKEIILRKEQDGKIFMTDNGHYIYDLHIGKIDNPWELQQELERIPGVVTDGLFLDIADIVMIGMQDGTVKEVLRK